MAKYIYKGKNQGLQLSANAGIGVEFLLGKNLAEIGDGTKEKDPFF